MGEPGPAVPVRHGTTWHVRWRRPEPTHRCHVRGRASGDRNRWYRIVRPSGPMISITLCRNSSGSASSCSSRISIWRCSATRVSFRARCSRERRSEMTVRCRFARGWGISPVTGRYCPPGNLPTIIGTSGRIFAEDVTAARVPARPRWPRPGRHRSDPVAARGRFFRRPREVPMRRRRRVRFSGRYRASGTVRGPKESGVHHDSLYECADMSLLSRHGRTHRFAHRVRSAARHDDADHHRDSSHQLAPRAVSAASRRRIRRKRKRQRILRQKSRGSVLGGRWGRSAQRIRSTAQRWWRTPSPRQ